MYVPLILNVCLVTRAYHSYLGAGSNYSIALALFLLSYGKVSNSPTPNGKAYLGEKYVTTNGSHYYKSAIQ